LPLIDDALLVFPDVLGLKSRLFGEHTLNYEMTKEAGVVRLVKAKDYEPELMYWDDGSLITVLTGVAIDPVHGKLIAGGVVERYFIVCDIDV
jgi:arylesterase / paraoxonase